MNDLISKLAMLSDEEIEEAVAFAKFLRHLRESMGTPVSVATVNAFSILVKELTEAE